MKNILKIIVLFCLLVIPNIANARVKYDYANRTMLVNDTIRARYSQQANTKKVQYRAAAKFEPEKVQMEQLEPLFKSNYIQDKNR